MEPMGTNRFKKNTTVTPHIGPPCHGAVVIPAKNEEKNIGKCLEAVYNQKTAYRFDVFVIDSGSSDQTVEIVKKFQAVKLVEIRPEEFGHGKTRNLGAEISTGDYIVFLNADAIPFDKNWLNRLIEPFTKTEKTAGVFSRHIPKEGCHLYMARDIRNSMPDKPMIRTKINPLDFMIFSTVSCAVRRDIWLKYPFDNTVAIAEDQQWARKILEQGLKIAYEPASMVYHSHNYTPRQLFEIKRKVGKASGRFKNRFSALLLGFFLMKGGMVFKLAGDIGFILFKSPGRIPLPIKLKEIKTAFKARIAGFTGRYMGWLRGAEVSNE